MGLLNKIKNIFSKKEENVINNDSNIYSEIVSISDSTYLVSLASRICVGMKPVEELNKRLEHITRVCGRGHQSVMEHTNIVVMIHFTEDYLEQFSMLTQSFKFLNFKLKKNNDIYTVLLGGSIRGYRELIKSTYADNTNRVYQEIKNLIKATCEKVFFDDYIKEGLIDDTYFINTINPQVTLFNTDKDKEGNYEADSSEVSTRNNIKTDVVDIINNVHVKAMDVFNKIKNYGFNRYDLLDFVTLSVIFHDISRPVSMQINRHRNPISQESQRYVNYNNKAFIDPLKYIKDKGMQNHKFDIEIFGVNKKIKSIDLGNDLCKVYSQLFKQNMFKQDARSFLPSNVCTKEIVTFTYRNLLHFLNLRCNKDSQPEIQYVANKLKEAIFIYDKEIFDDTNISDWIALSEASAQSLIISETIEQDKSIDEIISEEDV